MVHVPPTTNAAPARTPGSQATSSGSVPTTLSTVTAPTATLQISTLTISNGMFSNLTNDTKFSNLCLSKDNWPKWSQKIIEVMEMLEIDEYLHGNIPKLDNTVDPTSYRNWKGNNKKVIGFLKAYIEDGEEFFLATDNTCITWTNLINRHERQGPITQVQLIQEVLSIHYSKDVCAWSTTTNRIRDLCTR